MFGYSVQRPLSHWELSEEPQSERHSTFFSDWCDHCFTKRRGRCLVCPSRVLVRCEECRPEFYPSEDRLLKDWLKEVTSRSYEVFVRSATLCLWLSREKDVAQCVLPVTVVCCAQVIPVAGRNFWTHGSSLAHVFFVRREAAKCTTALLCLFSDRTHKTFLALSQPEINVLWCCFLVLNDRRSRSGKTVWSHCLRCHVNQAIDAKSACGMQQHEVKGTWAERFEIGSEAGKKVTENCPIKLWACFSSGTECGFLLTHRTKESPRLQLLCLRTWRSLKIHVVWAQGRSWINGVRWISSGSVQDQCDWAIYLQLIGMVHRGALPSYSFVPDWQWAQVEWDDRQCEAKRQIHLWAKCAPLTPFRRVWITKLWRKIRILGGKHRSRATPEVGDFAQVFQNITSVMLYIFTMTTP